LTRLLPCSKSLKQTAKSAVLVLAGLAWLARQKSLGQGTILTFHGLRKDEEPAGILDEGLHLPLSVFRQICAHLARHYQVIPLAEMMRMSGLGQRLPDRAIALTFDDGYASNYQLGFPVLKDFGLSATVFLTSGFLDETESLWFQEMDLAMQAKGEGAKLASTLAELKALPDAEMRRVVAAYGAEVSMPKTRPEVTRPMTWDMAREMQASGLVELGGHTHSHPILARCSLEQQRREIFTCHERLSAELGRAPKLFAYTNGGAEDFSTETCGLLAEAGFEAAFTMMSGRVKPGLNPYALPRYGSPETLWEAEATASGAFEMLREWRGGGRA
jgi:peptidoglycan/xylan/chitin deacetylase (PgdA/CDA1 family)